MKLKFKKVYLGEEYIFYVRFKPNSMECIVREFGKDEEIVGIVSDDFKFITLSKPVLLQARWTKIEELENLKSKLFYKLKVSKDNYYKVKDNVNDI